MIPKEIHRRFQYATNKIERMNLTLRTHIKRLGRKMICFSKKTLYLEAPLKIYFCGINFPLFEMTVIKLLTNLEKINIES